MENKSRSFFSRYEFLIPFFLFLLFMAASLPGIDWGAPALWNPDELVWRVDKALNGELQFDVTEPDFNYPSLPKQVMYLIGLITYGLGRSEYAFIVAARMFSSMLGALVGGLIYLIARVIGADRRVAMLASLLYIVSAVASANSRFAHNDLYLQFFCVLSLYFVIRFQYTRRYGWLFASFAAIGMAASSKYTGVSMVLLPVSVFIFMNRQNIKHEALRLLGVLFVGGMLVILGYGLGTPRLLLAPVDYLSKSVPAAFRFSQYGFNSGIPIGLYGQWAVFKDAVGVFAYYLFLAGFIWFAIRLVLRSLGKNLMNETNLPGIAILVLNIIIFDLPFLVSINYIPRHFIPFVPLLAILGAFFLEEIWRFAANRKWILLQVAIAAVVFLGTIYSGLRLVSIALLFKHDARIAAGSYIADMRGYGKSLEYTLYPPSVDKRHFMRAHNYPIYFVKYKDDTVPVGGLIIYNQGEEGLLERQTDYFVIDSYTYDRFYEDSICETIPVECDFFKRLLAGRVTSYRLLEKFTYRLPAWMPQVSVSSVNPDILIFERVH